MGLFLKKKLSPECARLSWNAACFEKITPVEIDAVRMMKYYHETETDRTGSRRMPVLSCRRDISSRWTCIYVIVKVSEDYLIDE